MAQSPEHMGFGARLLFGGLTLALGLAVTAVPLGVIPVDPTTVHAPAWVILTAGGMFALVGSWIVLAGTPAGRFLSLVVGPIVLIGMLSILHWVAFGPGVRQCSGGISIPFVSRWGPVGDLECRIAFGYGALLFDGVLASAGLSKLAERHLDGAPRRLVERLSHLILLLALAPFLVLLALLALLKAGAGALTAIGRR